MHLILVYIEVGCVCLMLVAAHIARAGLDWFPWSSSDVHEQANNVVSH
jgi:hypothetical protein